MYLRCFAFGVLRTLVFLVCSESDPTQEAWSSQLKSQVRLGAHPGKARQGLEAKEANLGVKGMRSFRYIPSIEGVENYH